MAVVGPEVIARIGIALLLATEAAAQGPPPIQDNSFLIEEAYNQERGVVQHISLFNRERGTGDWAYTFTQEWPLRGQRHQLSYTIPVLHVVGASDASTGPGDLLLNYRLQLAGGEGAPLWVAPRLSAILPTGRWERGRGDGAFGMQLSLPASFELTPRLAAHLNGGFSLHPSARGLSGARATLTTLSAGASVVFLLRPWLNLMLESVVQDAADVIGPGLTVRETAVFLNPGVRWAHNFRSGLQIVPGVAYTVGLGDASDRSGLVLYLSFEHSFKKN
jgi:hypothetical protein